MKAKIVRGSGFRGALNYVLDEGKNAKGNKLPEILAGTMLGKNARELSAEFAAVRRIRPDIAKPVWHCSLSCPPGERLDSEKWAAVAEDYMRQMGFPEGTQWVAVRHSDAKHEGVLRDHIHIVASRISLDGQIFHGKFEALRAIDLCQSLEEKHGLTRTKGLTEEERQVKPSKSSVRRMSERKGEALDNLPQHRLQRIVYTAMQGNPSVVEFVSAVQSTGVTVRSTIAKTGRICGFSFVYHDNKGESHAFKGSQLGTAFAWKGLQTAGVHYDQERDREELERLTAIRELDTAQEDASAYIRRAIDDALRTSPDVASFIAWLQDKRKVTARPSIAKDGHLSSFSFIYKNLKTTDKKLGKHYTLPELKMRGLQYEHTQEPKAIYIETIHQSRVIREEGAETNRGYGQGNRRDSGTAGRPPVLARLPQAGGAGLLSGADRQTRSGNHEPRRSFAESDSGGGAATSCWHYGSGEGGARGFGGHQRIAALSGGADRGRLGGGANAALGATDAPCDGGWIHVRPCLHSGERRLRVAAEKSGGVDSAHGTGDSSAAARAGRQVAATPAEIAGERITPDQSNWAAHWFEQHAARQQARMLEEQKLLECIEARNLATTEQQAAPGASETLSGHKIHEQQPGKGMGRR